MSKSMYSDEINLEQARAVLSLCFAASPSVPAMLIGAPGMGKSDTATQIVNEARKLYGEYCHCEINLATANQADFQGYLMPQDATYKVEETLHKIKEGIYTWPVWMRDKTTGKPAFLFKRGIIVMEEYGQSALDLKRATAPVIQYRRMGDYVLSGFDMLLLSNREEDRSGVTKDFDFLIDRRVTLRVKADPNVWETWATGNEVHPVCVAFANRNPDVVFGSSVPEKQGPWCTPRSLTMVSDLFKAAESMGMALGDQTITLALHGKVGAAAASQMMNFIRLDGQLPRFKDIISDPDNTLVPDQIDAQHIITYQLAAKVTPEQIKPVVTYMKRFKAGFGVTFIKALLRRDRAFTASKDVADWARTNRDIIAAITV